MSASLLGWAYRQKTGSGITKAVLVKLVDNANDDGFASPPMGKICAFLELSDKAVRDHIKKLEELGLVKVIRRKIAPNVNAPNVYQLRIWATSTLGEVEYDPRGSMEQDTPPIPLDVGEGGEAEGGRVSPDVPALPLTTLKDPGETLSTAVAVVAGPSELELAVEAFNLKAKTCAKWTSCINVSHARRAAILARLKEHGLEGWRRAVDLAAASAHLGGPVPTTGSHQGWRMDIAWFAKAEHFGKILEGGYAPARGHQDQRSASRQGLLQGIAEAGE